MEDFAPFVCIFVNSLFKIYDIISVPIKFREVNMKKKKLSMLLLTMTLSALSLTGCGSGAGQTASQPSSTAASAEPTSSEPSETEPPSPETVPAKTKSPDGGQTALNTMYLPDAAEDAGIYVEPIPDISDNFIRGMDVSSILVEEKSGVKYYSAEAQNKTYSPRWQKPA